jgi:hypothetical protein
MLFRVAVIGVFLFVILASVGCSGSAKEDLEKERAELEAAKAELKKARAELEELKPLSDKSKAASDSARTIAEAFLDTIKNKTYQETFTLVTKEYKDRLSKDEKEFKSLFGNVSHPSVQINEWVIDTVQLTEKQNQAVVKGKLKLDVTFFKFDQKQSKPHSPSFTLVMRLEPQPGVWAADSFTCEEFLIELP